MENAAERKVLCSGFTVEEERINSGIHALGILFGLIGVPLLLSIALAKKPLLAVISVAVYSVCFLLTFTCSTLFHACQKEKRKLLLEKFDRISIFLFIAGTYTPFIITYMKNATGTYLLWIIWAFAFAGMIMEIFFSKRLLVISLFFYLLMGLMFLFVMQSFFAHMPFTIICFIVAGVILYLVGVVFFIWEKIKHHHAIWHLLVLLASICHFIAVMQSIS